MKPRFHKLNPGYKITAVSRLLQIMCLLQLVCIAMNAYAIEDVVVKIAPAWNGYFQPESSSELGVQIISPQGGDYRLTLMGGNITSHHIGSIEADKLVKLWIPVYPTLNKPLTIELYQAGQLTFEQQLNFISNQQGLTATTLESYPAESSEQQVTVASDNLPRTAQGYGSIQTLILAPSNLTVLDDAQSLALSHYLQACNKLLLVKANKDELNQLRNIAGCNGQAVHLYREQPKDPFQQTAPSSRTLLALLQEQKRDSPITTLSLFFGCYLCILLLIPGTTKKPTSLFAIPILSSIVLIALWSFQENQTVIASWSEVESDSQQANFSAILSIEGINTSQYHLPLSSLFSLPRSLNNKTADLEFNQHQANTKQLTVTTRPFSHDHFFFQGPLSISHNISLTGSKGVPVVINHGKEKTAQAILSWQGKIISVPPLEPNKPWSPTGGSTIEISSTLNSMIQARTVADDTALILPHSLREAGLLPSHVKESGWLLIRPAT